MKWSKLLKDAAICTVLIELFFVWERWRGVTFPDWIVLAVIAYGFLLAVLAQRPKVWNKQPGGWLMALTAYALLYLLAFHINSFEPSEVWNAALQRFSWSYALQRVDADNFVPAYTIVASAAFTLFALFFIVVRRIDAYIAVRLLLISRGLLTAFVAATFALILRNEPWWRLALLVAASGGPLYSLSLNPGVWVADYSNDDPHAIAFWQNWITQRFGWARLGVFGLSVVPVFPVFGEWLFLFALIWQVQSGADGAVFLYLSDSTRGIKGFGRVLSRLIPIRIPAALTKMVSDIRKNRVVRPGVTTVAFFNIDPPST